MLLTDGTRDPPWDEASSGCEEIRIPHYKPWQKLDLFIFCAVILWIVLGSVLQAHEGSTRTSLTLRLSVTNVSLMISGLVLWRASMSAVSLLFSDLPYSFHLVCMEVISRWVGSTIVAILVVWSRHPGRLSLESVSRLAVMLFLALALIRAVHVTILLWIAPRLRTERRVLVVGTGPRAMRVAAAIRAHPRWRYHLLGFVDDEPLIKDERVLGCMADLESLLAKQAIDEVIIALPVKSRYDAIQNAIAACERVGVQSGYSMDFFTTHVAKRRSAQESDGSVVLHMVHNDGRRHLKRALDIFGSLMGLIVLSPVLLAVSVAVWSTSEGPVIFRQQRYGLNRRVFSMYKFRSMVVDAEQQ